MDKAIRILNHLPLFKKIEKMGYEIMALGNAVDQYSQTRQLQIIVNVPQEKSKDKPIPGYEERTPTSKPILENEKCTLISGSKIKRCPGPIPKPKPRKKQ